MKKNLDSSLYEVALCLTVGHKLLEEIDKEMLEKKKAKEFANKTFYVIWGVLLGVSLITPMFSVGIISSIGAVLFLALR